MLVHATWAKREANAGWTRQEKQNKKHIFTHWLFSAPAIPFAVELVLNPQMKMQLERMVGIFLLDFYQVLLFYSAAYKSLWGEAKEFT